jgi:predicted RNase H-like HicB family nuclease
MIPQSLPAGTCRGQCRRVDMRNEFTAVFERDGEWFIAYCPEIPGANGQGRSKEEAKKSLADAIALILQDRREDGLRAVPADAERDIVVVN